MPFALFWFYTVVFQSSEEWQKFPFEYKSIQLFVTGVLYLVTQSCRLPQSHIRNITFVMELANPQVPIGQNVLDSLEFHEYSWHAEIAPQSGIDALHLAGT